jgi:hypothetical protein
MTAKRKTATAVPPTAPTAVPTTVSATVLTVAPTTVSVTALTATSIIASTAVPTAASTSEFATFLEARRCLSTRTRKERAAGFSYCLSDGCLTVSDSKGVQRWRSDDQWWVEDFRLGDVDGKGRCDFLFTLWKSWSFDGHLPRGVATDSPEVRCHLFLYTMRSFEGEPVAKALWCSSNLPRPILAFELDESGPHTPVASGMLLHTTEGEYASGMDGFAPTHHTYAWQGWGFVKT